LTTTKAQLQKRVTAATTPTISSIANRELEITSIQLNQQPTTFKSLFLTSNPTISTNPLHATHDNLSARARSTTTLSKMKILTKEEEQEHYNATLKGGLTGGIAGLVFVRPPIFNPQQFPFPIATPKIVYPRYINTNPNI
jgi:hypothetical protein